MPVILPGDILVVRTPDVFGRVIRIGEHLQGKPDLQNHVAVVHHLKDGTIWCIEGRPGGVGWRDAAVYLESPYTITNAGQPRTADQREEVCAVMYSLLKTPYDWDAIGEDAASALRLPDMWAGNWAAGRAPGHVVCSSAAAYAHEKVGLDRPCPTDPRHVEPADWTAFIQSAPWAPSGAAAGTT